MADGNLQTRTLRIRGGAALSLGPQLGVGAQGSVFELASGPGDRVVKLYHGDAQTDLATRKLETMVARGIGDARLAWPVELVEDATRRIVGYTMPRANGRPLQRSIFVKPLLVTTFPTWTRLDLVDVALGLVGAFQLLHKRGVLVGDVNGANVIVGPSATNVVLVDLDSCQIESFRCPVGTVPFLAPRLIGQRLADVARTFDDESFALATLLFMTLLPGKPPYSHQGGCDPVENMLTRGFPYVVGEHDAEHAPRGPWAAIWSHLPVDLQMRFDAVFQAGRVVSPAEFRVSLERYRELLLRGHATLEIFPTQPRQRPFSAGAATANQMVEKVCKDCGTAFAISETEAHWYTERQYALPRRCRPCRSARRAAR